MCIKAQAIFVNINVTGSDMKVAWLVKGQLYTFTFDFAVFGSGDQIVSVQVQAGDGAHVTREQYHTCTRLQVPASSKKHLF